MTRGRFAGLLALLVAAVSCASFVVALQLLDDDPGSSTAGRTTTTTSAPAPEPGGLATPVFVAIVSSNAEEAEAQADAAELTERGYDGAVLRSDDHGSLEPGFWVADAGPFDDAAAAQTATDVMIADGYTAAYARCVGPAEECG